MSDAIPVLPVLSGRDLVCRLKSKRASLLDVGRPILVSSGSEAIRGALMHAGTGVGHEVLVPAFNCPSMVAPIHAVGATPIFFGITEDLCIDVSEVEAKLSSRVRAIIAPHFFGRLQDLRPIRELCDARGVRLIEDCAHALFGDGHGRMVGETGDYAIASPRKFLPLVEGGLLTSRIHDLTGLPVQRPAAIETARVAFDTVDVATAHGRLRGMLPLVVPAKALRRALTARHRRPPETLADPPAQPNRQPVAAASWVTGILLRHLMTEDLVARRQANYGYLHAALRGMTALRPVSIDPMKTTNVVPYMLPILLSRPHQQLPRLKGSGIPVWRWEHSHRGACRVTDRYAEALVQIPCHQSLRSDELLRIADALRSVADGG